MVWALRDRYNSRLTRFRAWTVSGPFSFPKPHFARQKTRATQRLCAA
jgi:hypothetical protein